MIKKSLTILLVISFAISTPVPFSTQHQTIAFAEEPKASHPLLRVKKLHQHENLYEELTEAIDGFRSALHEPSEEESSFVLFVKSLREDIFTKMIFFKELTESILNAPRFDLTETSADLQVMAFQDYLLQSFPESREFIPIHRRLFWADDLREVETYT